MNQSFFHRTFLHSALAILEPQIYMVVEQFGAENISLLSGRLVVKATKFEVETSFLCRKIENFS